MVVTGGTGALGAAVVATLLEAGAVCHVPYIAAREAELFPYRGHPNVKLSADIDLTREDAVARLYDSVPSIWASIYLAGGFAMAPLVNTKRSDLMQLVELMLDVAAGTGNASLPAASTGAQVTASDLTPELLEAGRRRADAAGLELEWVQADAEHLPFEDESFDVVMSCIGVMFAPQHQDAADELVRVCRPRRHDRAAELDARGHARCAVPDDVDVRRRRRRPVRSRRRCGGARSTSAGSSATASSSHTVQREVLEISAFERPHDYGEHFRAHYGPTIAVLANARRTGREAELVAALDRFCDEWNLGSGEPARFEQEYLLAVGRRR